MTYPNKNTTLNLKNFLLPIACCLLSFGTFAQKDTTKKIDITSNFKPVLRSPVKINLSPTQMTADSSKPSLEYTIPAQNLFYSYQAIPIQPVALEMDSSLYLGMRNYLKAGFGNFSTAYVSGGFSFGDGKKTLVNVYADYLSQKGKIQYQDYSKLSIKANGSYFMPKNEVYGSATITMKDNYLYGYDHEAYDYKKKDSIRNQFQDISLKAGYRNTVPTEYGISYDPNIEVSTFTNKNKLSESSLVLDAPMKKEFGDAFAVKIEGKADITTYTTKNLIPNIKFNNNIFSIAPSLAYSAPGFNINGGIIPTWNNGKFVWLPNVYAEAAIKIKGKPFVVQAGWVGRYVKNTFRNLSEINPFLETPFSQTNTKEIEYYGGIKATLGKHFSFSGKAGLVHLTNMQFFINDTANDSKTFILSNERKVNDFRVHGDLSYINQDKFTVTAGLTFNGYTGMKDNAKAWNTVPVEFTTSLRWWAFKQVMLKGDFYAFGGGNYLDKGNLARAFKGGKDLSAGVEFKINKMFSAWMDVNNILNNKYERWHNYQVYGLNVLGGVKVNF